MHTQPGKPSADPRKDHHMINGQLVPVETGRNERQQKSIGSSRRQPAKKTKAVEAPKPPSRMT